MEIKQQTNPMPIMLYQRIMDWIKTSRYIVPFLFLLGLARTTFSFLAYAPADGADGMKYYLYSAYISGIPLNSLVSELSPLYPYFIYIHRYVLGNFDYILVTQFIMSSLIGVIYFLALRRYHAGLAFIISLIIIGDMQTSLNFNFVATEPLYIFLIACAFAFSMQLEPEISIKKGLIFAILTGITVGLLAQTRTVGTFIIVPITILAIIKTWSWQQTLGILAGYGLISVFFVGLLTLNGVAQDGTVNQIMYFNYLRQTQALVSDADEDSSTYELQEAMQACNSSSTSSTTRLDCMQEELGGQAEFTAVIQRAYLESAFEQFASFISLLYENITKFLKMSGHQFFERDGFPADAQCENIEARYQRSLDFFDRIWAGVETSDVEREALNTTILDFTEQMCPPSKTIPEFQDLAWYISLRYRAISRPNPYLWYGLLLLLIAIVPWMRKLWYPIMMAGGLLFYHAVVSAVAINVQPRYVVVTNPFKIILVVSLIVLLIQQISMLAHQRLSKSEIED